MDTRLVPAVAICSHSWLGKAPISTSSGRDVNWTEVAARVAFARKHAVILSSPDYADCRERQRGSIGEEIQQYQREYRE